MGAWSAGEAVAASPRLFLKSLAQRVQAERRDSKFFENNFPVSKDAGGFVFDSLRSAENQIADRRATDLRSLSPITMQGRPNRDERGNGPHQHGDRGRGGGRGPGGPPPPPSGPSKFERIQAMRRESRAAIRRRQIEALDLAEALVAPATAAAAKSAVAEAPVPRAVPPSAAPLMHAAFFANAMMPATAPAAPPPDAGDLAVGVEAALAAAGEGAATHPRGQMIKSKVGGSFLCRPEQAALIRSSGGAGAGGGGGGKRGK